MRIFLDTANTVPYKVLQQAAKQPLTDAGLEQFLADWQTFTSRAVEGHAAPSR